MKFMRSVFMFVNILVVVATLLAYLAPQINPRSFWMFSLFGLLYPYLLVLNIIFIVGWALTKIKYSLLSLVTIVVGWVFLKGFFAFNVEDIASKNNEISVVSFNISNARKGYDNDAEKRKYKKNKMMSFLDRFKDEDILCFQEVGAYAYDLLHQEFGSYEIHSLKKGAVILSKHPIIEKGEIDFGTQTNSCLWANIKVGIDTIRVYSTHLQSNQISKDADEMVSGEIDEEKAWNGIRGMISKYKTYHIKRSDQSKKVKKHMNNCPYPIIMCGDLNDTPLSYTYTTIGEGMTDAFTDKGSGIGTTFRGSIPFLRIDYILVDPFFTPIKFQVIKENYSDHYPVASLLSINKLKT